MDINIGVVDDEICPARNATGRRHGVSLPGCRARRLLAFSPRLLAAECEWASEGGCKPEGENIIMQMTVLAYSSLAGAFQTRLSESSANCRMDPALKAAAPGEGDERDRFEVALQCWKYHLSGAA